MEAHGNKEITRFGISDGENDAHNQGAQKLVKLRPGKVPRNKPIRDMQEREKALRNEERFQQGVSYLVPPKKQKKLDKDEAPKNNFLEKCVAEKLCKELPEHKRRAGVTPRAVPKS